MDSWRFLVASGPQNRCSRVHASRFFEKSPVLVPGVVFRDILGDFTSVFTPKCHKKRRRKRSRKTSGFLTSFLLVFHHFWDPPGSSFGAQNHPILLPRTSREPPGSLLEPPGSLLEPPESLLEPLGSIFEPPGPDFSPISYPAVRSFD